jgi:hypothetical protein
MSNLKLYEKEFNLMQIYSMHDLMRKYYRKR